GRWWYRKRQLARSNKTAVEAVYYPNLSLPVQQGEVEGDSGNNAPNIIYPRVIELGQKQVPKETREIKDQSVLQNNNGEMEEIEEVESIQKKRRNYNSLI